MDSVERIRAAAHAHDVDDVMKALDTNGGGLTTQEAEERRQQYGPNQLPEPPRRGWIRRILSQFNHILIYVLLASAAVTFALGHLIDTFVILAVVIINAIIGLIQEGKAEKAMDAIRQMLAPRASVLRDGKRESVTGEDLVPGDIVVLEAGDKVPADLRLLEARNLETQEAILTGESLPVEKSARKAEAASALGDRTCMAYSGTLVTAGMGKGVVTATGSKTEVGRVSGMLSEVEVLSTPLVKQMDAFAKWLTALILSIAGLLLVYGYFVEQMAFRDMFMAVVGLSVAAIPEGLPAVLTITLAVGVQAMARRNAIIRRLPVIETLGSVSVICTDKTGTLTRNEMMVSAIAATGDLFRVEGAGYGPEGAVCRRDEPIDPAEVSILQEMGRAAFLCNDAEIQAHKGVWQVHGDPMEGALLAMASKLGRDGGTVRRDWTRTDSIPFDAKHRFMATLDHDHENHALVVVKGAPEKILSMCRQQRSADGDAASLDENFWHDEADRIAAEGQRVLAFAVREVSADKTVLEFSDVEEGLVFLGLVGLMDPPRPEAIKAVDECRKAGIRVKMITGDHRLTAAAIGRRIGLENADRVLTGSDIDAMDDAALAVAAKETNIFARTSPEHKLRLVMALQAIGMTVAMTGDGVNDAPALKRADAGIAMGLKGSEAAKEASEFVLADDNFSSIVAAVREGRTVYDNIKKVISWTLPTNGGESMTIVVALLFGMTLPITPVQILWVNLVTAVTLGIALAFEPPEENTMLRPPRPRDEPLLSGALIWHTILVSVLFLGGVFGMYAYATGQGYSLDLARTIALNTLVVMEIFQLFFIRNIYGTSLTWKAVRGTRVVWATVVTVIAAQFAFTYLPPFQLIFATEAVPFRDGLLIVGVGIALFTILEIEKQLRLALNRRTS